MKSLPNSINSDYSGYYAEHSISERYVEVVVEVTTKNVSYSKSKKLSTIIFLPSQTIIIPVIN